MQTEGCDGDPQHPKDPGLNLAKFKDNLSLEGLAKLKENLGLEGFVVQAEGCDGDLQDSKEPS